MSAARERGTTTRRGIGSAVLIGVLVVAAWLTIGSGLVAMAMAGSDAQAAGVPVRMGEQAPAWSESIVPAVEGWSVNGESIEPAAPAGTWPGGEALPVRRQGGLAMWAYGDPLTAILGSAALWAGLAAAGAIALVLVPAIRATIAGRPFAPGNSRRLAVAVAVTAAGWSASAFLPLLAATRAIQAENYPLPAGWLEPDLQPSWWPLVIAGLFAALAAASRRGSRLAADTDGLV